MTSYTRSESIELLPYPALVDALREAIAEYAQGEIACPERLVVPMEAGGKMLSMPAVSRDIAIHKLVNICPVNSSVKLPTIHGFVNAFDVRSGEPLFGLDGPTVTGRRTAAVSMLGIESLLRWKLKRIAVIGTGAQASNHIQAIAALFPGTQVYVQGMDSGQAREFCRANHQAAIELIPVVDGEMPSDVDVVITVTTSKSPVYAQPASAQRLIIAVGAFTPDAAEIAPVTILGSEIFVDDPSGAKHEAGDLIQAGTDWSKVKSLSSVFDAEPPSGVPILLKSVGCAAWDLAACRVARQMLAS